jgi:hypothetical protein
MTENHFNDGDRSFRITNSLGERLETFGVTTYRIFPTRPMTVCIKIVKRVMMYFLSASAVPLGAIFSALIAGFVLQVSMILNFLATQFTL